MPGETADMHFVHDCPRGRFRQRDVPFPIVGVRIDDHALHGGGCVVAFLTSRCTTVVFRNDHATAVGIQQYFVGIESQSRGRIEWSMDAIAIDLPRLSARNEYMPVVVTYGW